MQEQTTQFESFLSIIDNEEFYFGVGGIGDFLLLMSTFYDDVENITNVIFIANNVNPVKSLSALFPKIRLFLYDRNSFPATPEMWDIIISKRCIGTGVTPKRFEYIKDWNTCGHTDVFRYYGVKRICFWAVPASVSINPYIVLQPYGGSEDKTKAKLLSSKEIDSICKKYNGKHMLVLGNRGEIESFNKILTTIDCDKNFISTTSDIKQAFEAILVCKEFVGVDSWGKTLAALAGKKKIVVYKNLFSTDPLYIFGQQTDPGDYIFLHNWGFTFQERTL